MCSNLGKKQWHKDTTPKNCGNFITSCAFYKNSLILIMTVFEYEDVPNHSLPKPVYMQTRSS